MGSVDYKNPQAFCRNRTVSQPMSLPLHGHRRWLAYHKTCLLRSAGPDHSVPSFKTQTDIRPTPPTRLNASMPFRREMIKETTSAAEVHWRFTLEPRPQIWHLPASLTGYQTHLKLRRRKSYGCSISIPSSAPDPHHHSGQRCQQGKSQDGRTAVQFAIINKIGHWMTSTRITGLSTASGSRLHFFASLTSNVDVGFQKLSARALASCTQHRNRPTLFDNCRSPPLPSFLFQNFD